MMEPSKLQDTKVARLFGFPTEIEDQIISNVPAHCLANLALVSREFYIYANGLLYRNVFWMGQEAPLEVENTLGHNEAWLHNPERSSRIFRPSAFHNTISQAPLLRAEVVGASFSWDTKCDAVNLEVIKRILTLLSPSLRILHLSPSHFNEVSLLVKNPITSLDLPYIETSERYESSIQTLLVTLRSVFSMPTLRHVSLVNARSWNAFPDIRSSEKEKYANTSNVISISLPKTVPMGRDLRDILTWPKKLKSINHNAYSGDYKFPQDLVSPRKFIEGIYSQHDYLEELLYNNQGYGSNGEPHLMTFGRALRAFTQLKRMSITITCLFISEEESYVPRTKDPCPPAYEILPPSIEEILIDTELWSLWNKDGAFKYSEYRIEFRDFLLGVAEHKTDYFPRLRRVLLWTWGDVIDISMDDSTGEFVKVDPDKAWEELGVFSAFENAGISLEIAAFEDVGPTFATLNLSVGRREEAVE